MSLVLKLTRYVAFLDGVRESFTAYDDDEATAYGQALAEDYGASVWCVKAPNGEVIAGNQV